MVMYECSRAGESAVTLQLSNNHGPDSPDITFKPFSGPPGDVSSVSGPIVLPEVGHSLSMCHQPEK